MAFTPDQQYLADTVSLNKSVGDYEQCCLSVGGVVDVLNQSCELPQYDTSFQLDAMCGVAQQLAEEQPSAENQNGGGGINWGGIGNFINEFAETALPVFFPPQQPPASIGGGMGTGGTTPPPTDDKKGISTKGIVAIVVTVMTLAVAVYFIRKR